PSRHGGVAGRRDGAPLRRGRAGARRALRRDRPVGPGARALPESAVAAAEDEAPQGAGRRRRRRPPGGAPGAGGLRRRRRAQRDPPPGRADLLPRPPQTKHRRHEKEEKEADHDNDEADEQGEGRLMRRATAAVTLAAFLSALL